LSPAPLFSGATSEKLAPSRAKKPARPLPYTLTSFVDIAHELGLTEKQVQNACASGLRKIRARPGCLAKLLYLSSLLEAEREQRVFPS
jgi:hypothetical protein